MKTIYPQTQGGGVHKNYLPLARNLATQPKQGINGSIPPPPPPPVRQPTPPPVRESSQASSDRKSGSSGHSGANRPSTSVPVRSVDFDYAVYKGEDKHNYDSQSDGAAGSALLCLSVLLVILFFPFSMCCCLWIIQEYERAVVFRLGRLKRGGAQGPGLIFFLPCIDNIRVMDLRTVSFDVAPQEILTKDSVTVAVDAVVYYRVQNPTMAATNVRGYETATELLAATILRNVLGTKKLVDILSERSSIAENMRRYLDDATDPWGVKVERVEIKDVRLPTQLQRAMAAEAEASREAKAKVIAAEGELNASKSLKKAADIIAQSPAAIQLRYLQTLNTIASEKNSTIVFPLPMELLKT
ncbi:unnamed protein product [Cyprideis torosa]|uniref:Uncharacterized protein n=1 Tax=Cyprideis torosa TaxID=163714 RepID=A0A7R8ZS22_9CRUS|nr:unnamed protein product [Cyprideis torosa]CAG0905014.1 unnamed protein product [Cyprideis torosa]